MQQKLTSSYNRLVRPVAKNSDKLVVKLGIKLIQIISVVETHLNINLNIQLTPTIHCLKKKLFKLIELFISIK